VLPNIYRLKRVNAAAHEPKLTMDDLLIPDLLDDLPALLDPNLPTEVKEILEAPKLSSADFKKRIMMHEQDLRQVESESVDDCPLLSVRDLITLIQTFERPIAFARCTPKSESAMPSLSEWRSC